MRKQLALLTLLFSVSCVHPFWGGNIVTAKEKTETSNNETKKEETVSVKAVPKVKVTSGVSDIMSPKTNEEIAEINARNYAATQEAKIQEAQNKISALDKSDPMQWFIQYKTIQNEYVEWIDKDETIYDYYSKEDLWFLFQICEAEVTGTDNFMSKVNVASVIFNRLNSDKFPNDFYSILTQRSQFSSYSDGRYARVEVTETTILAVEYAFQFGDSTGGALYFDSCNGNSWASSNRNYLFTDAVGHSFYR